MNNQMAFYKTIKDKFRKCVYFMGNFLLMVPLYNFEDEELKYLKANKVYAMFHAAVVISLILYYNIPYNVDTEFLTFFHKINDVITLWLICLLAYNIVFIKAKRWKMYISTIHKINEERQTIDQNIFNLFHLHFCLGHVIFIGVYAIGSIRWAVYARKKVTILLFEEVIPEYYYFFLSLMLSYSIIIIKFQYEMVRKDLDEFCARQDILKYDSLALNKILHVSHNYMSTGYLVDLYNEIEGTKVIIVFGHTIVRILKAANWIIFLKKLTTTEKEDFFPILLSTILGIVSIIGNILKIIMELELL